MSQRSRPNPSPEPSSRHDRSVWRDSAGVAALALVLRIWHLIDLHRLPVFGVLQMDGRYHAQWAESLVQNGWRDPLVFFRAPFYPYFLAVLRTLTGELLWTARLAQLLLGVATVLLTHRIALRLLPRRWALGTGLAAALSWIPIHTETELLLEPLLTFLTTALLYGWVRAGGQPIGWKTGLAWGVLSGVAVVTRPNFALFVPVLVWWAGQVGRRSRAGGGRGSAWRPVGAILVGALLPILPVWIHNARLGDPATVVAWQGGINLYIGNHSSSNGWSAIAPGLRTDWQGSYDDAIRVAEARRGRPLRPSEVSRYWTEEAMRFWSADPGGALALTARKALLFWSAPEIRNNEDPEFYRSRLHSLRLPFVSLGLLIPLALPAMFVTWRRDARWRRLTLFVGAWFLSILPFFVCSRYRLPLHPPLTLLAAAGMQIGWSWLRVRDPRGWVLAAAVGFLALVLTPARAGVRAGGFYQGWNNLGDAWSAQRAWEPAIDAYRRSIALEPGYPNSHNNLGQALEKLERWSEAEAAYRAGLARSPDHPILVRNFAVVLDRQGRRAEALAVLQAQQARAPGDGPSALLLSRLQEAGGDANAARRTLETFLRQNPDSVPARVALVEFLRATGQVSEARSVLAEGLRRAPGLPQYVRLSQALGDTGMER